MNSLLLAGFGGKGGLEVAQVDLKGVARLKLVEVVDADDNVVVRRLLSDVDRYDEEEEMDDDSVSLEAYRR